MQMKTYIRATKTSHDNLDDNVAIRLKIGYHTLFIIEFATRM